MSISPLAKRVGAFLFLVHIGQCARHDCNVGLFQSPLGQRVREQLFFARLKIFWHQVALDRIAYLVCRKQVVTIICATVRAWDIVVNRHFLIFQNWLTANTAINFITTQQQFKFQCNCNFVCSSAFHDESKG